MKQRGPYAKSAAHREAILAAACAEFAANGFRGSLDEIARQAGITRAMLAYYYPTKASLSAELLERRDRLVPRLAGIEGTEPVESLRGVVQEIATELVTPGLVALRLTTSVDAPPDHPVRLYHVQRYASIVRGLTAILEGCRERRLLSPSVDVARAARAIVALMDGLAIQWLSDPDHVDVVGDVDRYIESLLVPEAGWR